MNKNVKPMKLSAFFTTLFLAAVCMASPGASAAGANITLLAAEGEEEAAGSLTATFIPGDISLTQWQAMGGRYNAGTLKIQYTGLTSDAMVWLSGADRAQFSISVESIPAGDGEIDIPIIYAPTKVGTHKATLIIDAMPTYLSASYSITGKAYNPAILPSLTVDTAAVRDFTAKVGETDQQDISYTVANALDFGSVRVEPAGNFILSSASLSKYAGTYKLGVTFRPSEPGEHTAKIYFSTPMGEERIVTVRGTATGTPGQEEKQGDELTFEGPALTYAMEDFYTEGAINKPLSMLYWKNVASIGTRAWWNYADATGNRMAKATAYDSKATENTPCQMILLSPQIDYRNTAMKLLCFNIMGDMMSEANNCRLDVGMIDATRLDAPEGPVAEIIDGLNIPSTSDENGKWVRYVLDTESWSLPDKFYIAFIFSGERGRESVAQYYVDDFSWGREDVPFIRTSHSLLQAETLENTDYTYEPLTIKGFNLDTPIEVSISGTHAANFRSSVTSLPAEGGTFSVTFNSADLGEHNALITLKSGDAQSHVLLSAVNDISNGVASVATSGTCVAYDLYGRRVEASKSAKGSILIIRDEQGNVTKHIR